MSPADTAALRVVEFFSDCDLARKCAEDAQRAMVNNDPVLAGDALDRADRVVRMLEMRLTDARAAVERAVEYKEQHE